MEFHQEILSWNKREKEVQMKKKEKIVSEKIIEKQNGEPDWPLSEMMIIKVAHLQYTEERKENSRRWTCSTYLLSAVFVDFIVKRTL